MGLQYGAGYYNIFNDPTLLLLLPVFLFALWAQFHVGSVYRKYDQYPSQKGESGARVAEQMLWDNGIDDVQINCIPGRLTDHYDPRSRVLNLSEGVYHGSSLAALGIAAHEVGHVLQHYEMYAPLIMRQRFVPVAQIGSFAAIPLFMLGLFLSSQTFVWAGIITFAAVVLFYLVTLPVEFNATNRAIFALEAGEHLSFEEARPARKVLSAAGLTYIAAALQALLQLFRLILLSGGRRRGN